MKRILTKTILCCIIILLSACACPQNISSDNNSQNSYVSESETASEYVSKIVNTTQRFFSINGVIYRVDSQEYVEAVLEGEIVSISENQIIYFSDNEKLTLSVFDINKAETKQLYKFVEGNFEFLAVENNTIYGIWNSIFQSKSYFVGIDMKTSTLIPFLDLQANSDIAVLNSAVYYMDSSGENLQFHSLDQFRETALTKMNIETAWTYLQNEYFTWSEIATTKYDNDGRLLAIVWRGEMPFSNEGKLYDCESVVFYDGTGDGWYAFGHYYVYYDNSNEIYGLKSGNWYYVDYYTGKITLNHAP